MDDQQFDRLARLVGGGLSRRGLLRAGVGGGLAALVGFAPSWLGDAVVAKKQRKKKCKNGKKKCGNKCVDKQSDENNCGGCGSRCNGTACTNGQCAANPNPNPCANVDTQNDPNHCGGCGNRCAGGAGCAGGQCRCPDGQTVCDNVCVDTDDDPDNCGGCAGDGGETCAENGICDGGECDCPEGAETLCDGACVDIESDPNNCGGCAGDGGVVCPNGAACVAGGCVGESQFRVVLRWDEEPRDLDSHLWLPAATPYHVYYPSSRRGSATQFPFALLDRDDTTSFGPETTTIFDVQEGAYRFAVYNFSGSCCLTTSGATVQLFRGSNLLQEWEVPEVEGNTNRWWHVFDVDDDGAVTNVNQLLAASPVPYADPAALSAARASEEKRANEDEQRRSGGNRNADGGRSSIVRRSGHGGRNRQRNTTERAPRGRGRTRQRRRG